MEPNIFFTHATSAAILAYILSHAQQWEKIPWINRDTKRLNAALRAGLAAAAGIGIHWQWAGTWGVGRTLTITIPAIAVVGHAFFTWAGQYAMQQGWEKIFNIGGRVDPKVLTDVADAVVARLQAAPVGAPAQWGSKK